MTRKLLVLLVSISLLSSCASREKLRYYQNIEEAAYSESLTYNPMLKSDDLLSIIVSSPNAEATVNFNIASYGVGTSGVTTGQTTNVSPVQTQYQSYLIDNEGYIDFPVIGRLKLGGLSRKNAIELIKSKLKVYIKDPSVTMRILNFKITVQGEVRGPGTFPISTERVTLPEALAMAGDLTIYGKRDNILIIREVDGRKTYNYVDITQADIINSPFYYLTQNDLIYVEPNKTQMNSSVVGREIQLVLAGVGLLLTVYTIFNRN